MLFSGLFEKVDRRVGSEDKAMKGVDLLAAEDFVTVIFSICDDFFESFALIVADQDASGPLLLTLVSFRFCILADFIEAWAEALSLDTGEKARDLRGGPLK